jgi:hypothetical protein
MSENIMGRGGVIPLCGGIMLPQRKSNKQRRWTAFYLETLTRIQKAQTLFDYGFKGLPCPHQYNIWLMAGFGVMRLTGRQQM